MEFKGSSAYDQVEFFKNYMKRRGRLDSPNNAIEGPIIYELMGDFQEKKVLDLGCGDASFGKELLEKGAKHYLGIEGSEQMVATAKENLLNRNGIVHFGTMESFHFPVNEFDIITSRFAIHYIEDIQKLFNRVYDTLNDNGRFIFSVQHPLTTSSFVSKQTGDKRGNWVVDDYFLDGVRKEPWIDKVVVKYHRTIEQYFTALKNAGFSVLDLREGTPKRAHFSSEEEYERRLRIPIVLAFSCLKV
ncbi:class I SAM-dependent methyltransferase [Psychrobacillus sp. NPDC093180]|uniref:class I SAM-dependent methyltransferase n=1 Tax=Psychrobacillus sp. NPDC093180 TaxID=3364489 RepID=UPI003825E19C